MGGGTLIMLIVGGAGGKPILLFAAVTVVLMMLPSSADLCVMLKVSASGPSEPAGAVRSRGVATASSIVSWSSTPCMSTEVWMSIIGSSPPPAVLEASGRMPSPLPSSESPEGDWFCLPEECLRLRGLMLIGREMGAYGVVGDSGCEVIPVCRAGSIDGNRSASRTGRRPNPSEVSMDGSAVAKGCRPLRRLVGIGPEWL